jgi:hypothetical protein
MAPARADIRSPNQDLWLAFITHQLSLSAVSVGFGAAGEIFLSVQVPPMVTFQLMHQRSAIHIILLMI